MANKNPGTQDICVGIGEGESLMYLLSNIAKYSWTERFLCINVVLQITSANTKCHSGSDLVVCLWSLHSIFNTASAINLLLLFWCSLQ